MKTKVVCRQYKDGEIAIMFPEDTVGGKTPTFLLRMSERGFYLTHHEEVNYHDIIARTRPMSEEEALEPMHIAQRDESIYGEGRRLVQKQRYSFNVR